MSLISFFPSTLTSGGPEAGRELEPPGPERVLPASALPEERRGGPQRRRLRVRPDRRGQHGEVPARPEGHDRQGQEVEGPVPEARLQDRRGRVGLCFPAQVREEDRRGGEDGGRAQGVPAGGGEARTEGAVAGCQKGGTHRAGAQVLEEREGVEENTSIE